MHSINNLIHKLLSNSASFALYRLPQTEKINLMWSYEGFKELSEISLEELPAGFIMSEFEGKNLFLKAEKTWNSSEPIPESSPSTAGTFPFHARPCNIRSTEERDYISFVDECIRAIENHKLDKIVPARVQVREKDQNLDLIKIFNNLTAAYPNAFISLISSPQTGTWMGASPEIMVETRDSTTFRTVAVAGTQPYLKQHLSEVAWKQKEIEEQAFVSRYIINCFKKIRLREFEEYGPKTVIAGNLLHLKTIFEVDMQTTAFPNLGSVMLKLLHPTSAVCGMPLEDSREFLKKHENLDRSFFAGYLGPVNFHQSTNLFVNLRCMEVFEQKVALYAGAGVTIDSIPEKELAETGIKFETLGNFI